MIYLNQFNFWIFQNHSIPSSEPVPVVEQIPKEVSISKESI